MDEMLKTLQKHELLIAQEIKRICEKNNIQYFLIAGSVLGAVRHNGFIPWDDDMDVGMLRSEYKKFMIACETDLSDDFFLQTWDNEEEYPFSYAKMRLNGTVAHEAFSEGVQMHRGIFVDIFPYDNAPMRKIPTRIQAIKYKVLGKALWLKKGFGKNLRQKGLKTRIKYNISRAFVSFVPYKSMKKWLKKTMNKYNDRQSEYVVINASYSFRRDMMHTSWIKNLTEISFEGINFPCPKEIDAYLTHIYGDYMKLPPENQRHHHEIESIEFLESYKELF